MPNLRSSNWKWITIVVGVIYIYCFLIILGFFQWMVMPIDNPKETTPQYLSATSCECQAQQDGLTAAANAAKDSVKKIVYIEIS